MRAISEEYRIGIQRRFSAAHKLYEYSGKCADLHGHTWLVEAVFSGEALDQRGMLCDFEELRELLGETIAFLDHTFLNEVKPFDEISPTAENVARLIRERLKPSLQAKGWNISLHEVKIWESPDCWASIMGGD